MKRNDLSPGSAFTLLAIVLSLAAGQAVAAGNAAEGAKKAQFCAGCHGPDGNYTHTGTPRLAGQPEAQFVAKMKNYRAGAKGFYHPMMAILVNGLNDQDIADLGAYYAAQKVEPSLKPYRPPQ